MHHYSKPCKNLTKSLLTEACILQTKGNQLKDLELSSKGRRVGKDKMHWKEEEERRKTQLKEMHLIPEHAKYIGKK